MTRDRLNYVEILGKGPVQGQWDGMRIGSEFCSQLLPSVQKIQSLSDEISPGSLSLVTPVAGPDEVEGVMSVVKAAVSARWGEIVVNDWGVLSGVTGLAEPDSECGIGITAGRLLMRFRRGPGTYELTDSPVGEPDPAIRRYFAWGPLYDSPFLAFLKAKSVDRIELDLPRDWLPIPDLDDFHFSLHLSTRFVSLSAVCPWLYNPDTATWSPVNSCGCVCKSGNVIKMSNPLLKGPLYLSGRAILERVDADIDELVLPDRVDRIIYDGSLKRV